MSTCIKCGGTGKIITESLGLTVKCSCAIEGESKTKNIITEKPIYSVTKADEISCVERGLVPKHRENDEYSSDKVLETIGEMAKAQKFEIKGWGEYSKTLDKIISTISIGEKLDSSYILGAPNGFGKTTFANTCIKRLDSMGYKAVPYISLFEIAELRGEYEKRILGYINRENIGEGNEEIKFNWKDYVESDLLITYLTTLDNKKIEVSTLKTIMDIRGPKGLPTIVFTSSSLKPYLSDIVHKKVIWDDILAYSDNNTKIDRLIHKSCYKVYR